MMAENVMNAEMIFFSYYHNPVTVSSILLCVLQQQIIIPLFCSFIVKDPAAKVQQQDLNLSKKHMQKNDFRFFSGNVCHRPLGILEGSHVFQLVFLGIQFHAVEDEGGIPIPSIALGAGLYDLEHHAVGHQRLYRKEVVRRDVQLLRQLHTVPLLPVEEAHFLGLGCGFPVQQGGFNDAVGLENRGFALGQLGAFQSDFLAGQQVNVIVTVVGEETADGAA